MQPYHANKLLLDLDCATSRPESPLSLYKQAVRLVQQQPCGDVSADAVIQEKLTKAITLLEAQQSGAEQTGQAALAGRTRGAGVPFASLSTAVDQACSSATNPRPEPDRRSSHQ